MNKEDRQMTEKIESEFVYGRRPAIEKRAEVERGTVTVTQGSPTP